MIHSISSFRPLPTGVLQYTPPFIEENGAILLKVKEEELLIGLVEDNEAVQDRLNFFHRSSRKKLTFLTVDKKDLAISLARIVSESSDLSEGAIEGSGMSLTLDKLAGDAPIINLVNSVFMEGIEQRASDIHIEKMDNAVQVRYRIDGVLHVVRTLDAALFPYISSRIKIMAQLNIMENRLPQDGRITVSLGSDEVDLRVSIVPIAGEGESIVLRVLHRSEKPLMLDELGFVKEHIQEISLLTGKPNGLLLVTGPTGCGKSTTLNALLQYIKSDRLKIVSIEDPVEYYVPGVDQIQTNEEIGLGFSTLLRRVLRQDPNIIMIGEIRDSETAELAVRSALTGHLVISTLHTNDAVSAIPRLLNMGVEPYLLASVLKGVSAQRLVRVVCPDCREERKLTPGEIQLFEKKGIKAPSVLTLGKGCSACDHSGYRGRTLINEMFSVDENLEDLISRNGSRTELRDFLRKKKAAGLFEDGLIKVKEGITTIEEVERAVDS